jgi:hypothetical protein
VSQKEYEAWLVEASKKFASTDRGPLHLAYSETSGQR